jgi:hypothetical protein
VVRGVKGRAGKHDDKGEWVSTSITNRGCSVNSALLLAACSSIGASPSSLFRLCKA